MRSTFIASTAFAAGILAVPFAAKRDIVTDYEIDYVTKIVTVTAGAEPAATSEAATTVQRQQHHYGHNHWHPYSGYSEWSSATTETESEAAPSTSSSTYVPPPTSSSTSEAPTSTSEAPASTSTYVAPTPTSSATPTTESSVAPTSTEAPSSSVAAPSYSSSSDTSGAVPTSYDEITVFHHNLHRSNHSASGVAFNASLAKTAMKIAKTCVYAHNVDMDGGGYGQNIAAGVPAQNISATITDLFYNGEVGWYDGLYGQAQPDMTNFEHFGHFTQIVWKETASVGCATYDCSAHGKTLANVGDNVGQQFTVCNYYPPGNYANEYADNIGSPLNQPTAQWNEDGYEVQSTSPDS